MQELPMVELSGMPQSRALPRLGEDAGAEAALARFQTAMRVPVGGLSPLWMMFAGAASAGVAYWWMTRWTRPVNLEALLTEPPAETPVEAVEVFEAVEVVETVEALPEAVAETVVETAEAMQAAAEEVSEPIVEVIVEGAPADLAPPPEPAPLEAAPVDEPPAPVAAAPKKKAAPQPKAASTKAASPKSE
jgi:hypothetical protein